MNAVLSLGIVRPATPLRNAAEARRTTPGPQSTMYGVSLTTMATDGPERSGSADGFPVPSSTIWVRGGEVAGVGVGVGVCARLAMGGRKNNNISTNPYGRILFGDFTRCRWRVRCMRVRYQGKSAMASRHRQHASRVRSPNRGI